MELHPPGWCHTHNWELQTPLSELGEEGEGEGEEEEEGREEKNPAFDPLTELLTLLVLASVSLLLLIRGKEPIMGADSLGVQVFKA